MVEVAYALPDQQLIIPIQVTAETKAEEAIRASGILQKFPEIDLTTQHIGIFGKVSRLDAPLHHMDRIEIYRPLIVDQKEKRKQRAEEAKSAK